MALEGLTQALEAGRISEIRTILMGLDREERELLPCGGEPTPELPHHGLGRGVQRRCSDS